jgi:hypothetical protein
VSGRDRRTIGRRCETVWHMTCKPIGMSAAVRFVQFPTRFGIEWSDFNIRIPFQRVLLRM